MEVINIFDVQYIKEVFRSMNLTPLFDSYKNSREKLKAMDKDGYIVFTNLDNLRRESMPKAFHKSNPFTIDNIRTYISKNRDGFCILSDTYDGNKAKMKFKCPSSHVFYMSWDNFYSGNGCCYCYGNYKKTHTGFCEDIKNKYGDEYKVIGTYISSDEKIKIMHNNCGNIYEVRPYSILGGRGCNECYGNILKTTDMFISEVYKLYGYEYEVVGEYINSKHKIEMKHVECKSTYSVTPQSFLSGTRCPICNASKGEKAVELYLNKKGHNFKREFKIDGCIFKTHLRFDFAVFDNDGEIISLIEYDGRQHFEPVEIFGGEKGYNETVVRDKIKNKYCEDNGIPICRIPYHKIEKIDDILDSVFYNI